MKTNVKSVLAITSLCLLAIAGCKKEEDNAVKARLTGKWKVVQKAVDKNHNGAMDAAEIVTAHDSLKLFFTFNGDGSGNLTSDLWGTTTTVGYSWTLINNDASLNIKQTTGSSTPINEGTVHIQSLTATDLITWVSITVDGVQTNDWTILKKQ